MPKKAQTIIMRRTYIVYDPTAGRKPEDQPALHAFPSSSLPLPGHPFSVAKMLGLHSSFVGVPDVINSTKG